jgi:hypothetical protein
MNDSDLNRLPSLLKTMGRIKHSGMRMQDGSGIDTTEDNLRQYREEAAEIIAGATDGELATTYQQTSGELGAADVDALLAEIKRRNLDIR